ncbi:DUF2474 family protein [Vibrio coralliilyticus]|nr:DUF2474 family protein [Vibrio coralliilyticus]AXN34304.1 DUF2474 family protein [Vibrio coralliilyticus]MCC2520925.1 DUF2474 family protein [Vibrio coralliilyticus]NOI27685.1 DUF2474 family protein [Vibrio coralliilyticus]NOI47195.1 DUF2474 family protein [Vibrio coralliilyticus]NOI57975.1 DUF2474 family protein [Vibrio coralliilyticus]
MKQFGWFFLIWLASVLALTTLSYAIRLALNI